MGPTVDFSALRSGHLAEPLDATTTKAIEMQIERLLVLAGGPTFEVQLREQTQTPLSSPSQPVAVGGGADGAALRKRPQSATPERDLLVRMGGMSSSLPEGVGLGGSRRGDCHEGTFHGFRCERRRERYDSPDAAAAAAADVRVNAQVRGRCRHVV